MFWLICKGLEISYFSLYMTTFSIPLLSIFQDPTGGSTGCCNEKFVQPETMPGVYAMVDSNAGVLLRKWLLVDDLEFTYGDNCIKLFVCDCTVGHEQKVRLSSISSLIKSENYFWQT
jgi:hypothetical protein